MTEPQRISLLTACAFAKGFLEGADVELRGGDPSWRQESAEQLAAALRNLEADADWRNLDARP